jgi:adenosylmethionine-8-amino-7-oxononanoate aminotransferase
MGAVLMSERIYAGIADSAPAGSPIGHGVTYSAHPVSAAVALEVLRLYGEGGLLANGQAMEKHFARGLADLLDHPLVGDARSRGLLGALELVANKNTKSRLDPSLRISERLFETGYRNGLIFRAFGDDVLGFAPALCYREQDFELLFERLRKTLDETLEAVDVRRALG